MKALEGSPDAATCEASGLSLRQRSTLIKALSVTAVAVLLSLLAGCDALRSIPPPDIDLTPTTTPPLPVMAASATIDPAVPTPANPETGNAEISLFTPGAVPTAVDSSSTITPIPLPTLPSIEFRAMAQDGLRLVGQYYGTPGRVAPTVLLLHEYGATQQSWVTLVLALREAGYNVLTVDLRGFGLTGGTPDWSRASADVAVWLQELSILPNVEKSRLSVVGAGVGASLALSGCALYGNCRSVVALSPTVADRGLQTDAAVTAYGPRPLLIISSSAASPSGIDSQTLDKLAAGPHQLQLYEGTAVGVNVLAAHSTALTLIVEWLRKN
jgi:dienelactone hydrolase